MTRAHQRVTEQDSVASNIQFGAPPPLPGYMRKLASPSACCSWNFCCRIFIGICVTLGFIMAIAGIVLVLQYRAIFVQQLTKIVPMTEDSPSYQLFTSNTGGGLSMRFYFFNLTNADDVANLGLKPKFHEIGPYVYTIDEPKEKIVFNENGTEVSFSYRKFYHFDPKESRGTEDDLLIQLDFVAYGGLLTATEKGMGPMGAMLLSGAKRDAPFKEHRVGELLWGGADTLYSTLMSVASQFGMSTSSSGNDDKEKFGFMYGKNGSLSGNYTIFTGTDEINKLQKVRVYDGQDGRLDNIWPVSNLTDVNDMPFDANAIRGYLGTQFPPDVTKNSQLTVFASDMCFSLDLKYWTISYAGDIEVLRFGINYQTWHRLTTQINRGLCSEEERDDKKSCAQDGVFNVTKCRDNLPIILSWPHFFEADSYYLDQVEGLSPDESKHAVFADVDSLTGLTVRVAERVQVNFPLKALPHAGYGNLPSFTLFPVMWIEQYGEISPEGVTQLKSFVYNKYHALRTFAYGLLITSVILLPVSVLIFFIYQCHETGRCCRV